MEVLIIDIDSLIEMLDPTNLEKYVQEDVDDNRMILEIHETAKENFRNLRDAMFGNGILEARYE